jgi:sensor histidine kinase regulating citrate/malate metabolism
MGSLSIRFRVAIAVIGCLFLVAIAASLLVGHIVRRNLDLAAADSLMRAAQGFASLERSDVEKLSATLDVLLARQDLKEAFLARDREGLQAAAAPILEVLSHQDGITHWYFHDAEPRTFLRVHRPDLFGDKIERATMRKAMETQAASSGKELGRTAFALRVVKPYRDGGRLIGYVEVGEEIDHFLRRMKDQTGDDFGLLVKKAYLDEEAWRAIAGRRPSTWKDRPDVVLVDATSYGEGIADFRGDIDDVPERGLTLEETVRHGRTHVRGMYPVTDAGGRRVGALFVSHDVSEVHEAVEGGLARLRWAVLAVCALGAAGLLALLHHLVLGRLRRAALAAERISLRLPAGRHGAGTEVITASADELTRVEDFLRRFSEAVMEPGEGQQLP